jgi:hypothetical protein
MAIANWDDIWGTNIKTQYDLILTQQANLNALTTQMVASSNGLANRVANNAATIDNLAQLATLGVLVAARTIDAEVVKGLTDFSATAIAKVAEAMKFQTAPDPAPTP